MYPVSYLVEMKLFQNCFKLFKMPVGSVYHGELMHVGSVYLRELMHVGYVYHAGAHACGFCVP